MPRSLFRTTLAVVALVLTMSACDMTVRLGTSVETDGSGTFTLAIQMDREMRDILEQNQEGRAFETLEALFDRLRTAGWPVTTSQPDGGVAWTAKRAFADSAGFDEAIAELGSAQGDTTDALSGLRLEVDQSVERSFLRTNSRFSGVVDTTGGETVDEEMREILRTVGEVVHFEVRADLPGAVTEQVGDGTVRDGSVVWRPQLGSELRFSANASSLNTGALMMVLVPALGLLAGGGWFLAGRRRGSVPLLADDEAAEEMLLEEMIITEPAQNGFLAIKPLESIDLSEAAAEKDPDPV